TGRPFSAVLVDHRTVGLDRELVRRASAAGCPVIVVGGADDPGRLASLGATAHMVDPPNLQDLDGMLARHATPIGRIDDLRLGLRAEDGPVGWTGRMVAVTGPGGTGASTVARLLAAALADDPRMYSSVLLVDACLEADQAHMHGITDSQVDLQAAARAHRNGDPVDSELRALTFVPAGHRHRLLPGIRQRRDWPTIGGPSLEAALGNLRDHHLATIVDVDPYVDLAPTHQPVGPTTPGEPARIVFGMADLVLVVGRAGSDSVRSLARVRANLADSGLPAERVMELPLTSSPAVGRLASRRAGRAARRGQAVQSGDLVLDLPGTLDGSDTAAHLADRVLTVLDRLPSRTQNQNEVAVIAGSLGTTSDDEP
ncbi:MAG: hypothetical protein ABGY25_01230, partial [Acidimicrobiales bacterium]